VILGVHGPREMENSVGFMSIGGIGVLEFCKRTGFCTVMGLVTFMHRKLGCSILSTQ